MPPNNVKFEDLPGAKEWASSPMAEELIKRMTERIGVMGSIANNTCAHCGVADEARAEQAAEARGVIAGLTSIRTALINARGVAAVAAETPV